MGGQAFAGKPLIAVLGLEVRDEAGTPTPQDTDVAKKLTEGLRGRAKLGSGPYQIAGNSDKELIDEKLLKNCDSEKEGCMSQIGNDLGADVLMFGKIEKKGGAYTVTVKLLDVHQKRFIKSSLDPIPLAQATNDAELGEWAKKIYAKLTGEKSTGSLVIKLTNADHGTILINGEEKGTITNNTGQVANLDEKTYKVAIESEGFRRWEESIPVKAGDATTRSVTLEKNAVPTPGGTGGGIITPPGGGGGVGPGPGPVGGGGGGGTRGNAMWKGVFVGSLVVGIAGGGLWFYGHGQIDDASKALRAGCAYAGDQPAGCADGSVTPLSAADVKTQNDKGDKGHTYTIVGSVTVGVAGALALVAFYEGFIAKTDGGGGEHAEAGHRVRRDRFVVKPVIAPNGGGATLQFDW
jgi:hypothetical protein